MPTLRIPPNRPSFRRQGGGAVGVDEDVTAKGPSPKATHVDADDNVTEELHVAYPGALHNEVRIDTHPEQLADLPGCTAQRGEDRHAP